jgi:DNA modification methylase
MRASSTSEGSAADVTARAVDGTRSHIGGICSCEYYRTVTEEISHFATFPEALPERCIKAGSRLSDTVLDPFCGSGTTGRVALRLGRAFVGIELNPTYAEMARERIGGAAPLFTHEEAG